MWLLSHNCLFVHFFKFFYVALCRESLTTDYVPWFFTSRELKKIIFSNISRDSVYLRIGLLESQNLAGNMGAV